jgi:uncharacterized protein (TIGR02145 family)
MRIPGIRYPKSIFFGILVLLSFSCEKVSENQVVDIDGNIYPNVTIGNQVWMAENLKTTKLNDGTVIPLVIDDTQWKNLTTPGYCWYGNYEAFFSLNHYGSLYNFYAVSSGKLCPTGWHVPDDDEWKILELFLGSDSAGGKLKETGTRNWHSPNNGATNETGFCALPGGYRNSYYNDFKMFRSIAYYWSSSYESHWNVNSYYTQLNNGTMSLTDGISVRCIKN